MRVHPQTARKEKRAEKAEREKTDAWKQFVSGFKFQPGDRIRLTRDAIAELKMWAVKLDRPDTRGIVNEDTRATFINPISEMCGHTILIRIDGQESAESFWHGYWEKA